MKTKSFSSYWEIQSYTIYYPSEHPAITMLIIYQLFGCSQLCRLLIHGQTAVPSSVCLPSPLPAVPRCFHVAVGLGTKLRPEEERGLLGGTEISIYNLNIYIYVYMCVYIYVDINDIYAMYAIECLTSLMTIQKIKVKISFIYVSEVQ